MGLRSLEELVRSAADTARANTKATTSTEPARTCPFSKCDGTGWIYTSDEQGDRARRCRCLVTQEEQARLERITKAASIPERYRQKRLDNFEAERQKMAWKIACRYVDQFENIRHESKNGLCLVGPTGTGKSHLAYAILNSLIAKGVTGVCGSVPELMDLLKPQAGQDRSPEERPEARLEALKTADMLVLDDLGAQRDTAWVTERLYVITNYRYNRLLPVVITSNLELEALEEIPGWERIVSRLFEMCHLIRMDGPDYRKGDLDADNFQKGASKAISVLSDGRGHGGSRAGGPGCRSEIQPGG